MHRYGYMPARDGATRDLQVLPLLPSRSLPQNLAAKSFSVLGYTYFASANGLLSAPLAGGQETLDLADIPAAHTLPFASGCQLGNELALVVLFGELLQICGALHYG